MLLPPTNTCFSGGALGDDVIPQIQLFVEPTLREIVGSLGEHRIVVVATGERHSYYCVLMAVCIYGRSLKGNGVRKQSCSL